MPPLSVQKVHSNYRTMPNQNNLHNQIHDFIRQHNLIPPGSTIIVGLSGGPDSLFLLHTLHAFAQQNRITLIAAHLDHEWRSNSHEDVMFCQKVANNLGIKLIVGKRTALEHTIRPNGSRQALGRALRRLFFHQIAQEYQADRIALAHHADDQQETFFLRMLRGASLTGLTGIKAQQGVYIRPLLTINKTAIITYLNDNTIAYLTDPSNSSDVYLRNRLRKHVLPALRQCDNRFDHTFMATITRLQETESYLEKVTSNALNGVCLTNNQHHIIDIPAFLAYDPIIQQRMVVQWLIRYQAPFTPSTRLMQELIRFFEQPGNKTHALHTHWMVEKQDGKAKIVKKIRVAVPRL